MQNLGSGGTDSMGRMSYTLHAINEGSISDDSEANVSGTSGFGLGGGAKRSADDAGLDHEPESIGISSDDDPMDKPEPPKKTPPPNGKKTKGRVKIKMEFIDNKLRRYTTFSKRKTGIMKKAYELSTLTGTQVMLLVASETGHVYTFATRKLQPMITSEAGKALIQTCLNSPDPPMNHSQQLDQRMSATGFEETDLTYSVTEEDQKETKSQTGFGGSSSQAESSATSPTSHTNSNSATLPVTVLNSSVPTTKSNISVQLPAGAASYAAILASGVAQAAASAQQSSSSETAQNTVTMVPATQQNLSLVSGNMVIPGQAVVATTANSLSGAVMYQTAQGVVYATPTSSLSEGVILNFGQAPALQIPQDQGGSSAPQQFITIPVPVSLTAAPQIIQTQSGLSPSTSSSSSEPSSSPGVTDLSKSSSRK